MVDDMIVERLFSQSQCHSKSPHGVICSLGVREIGEIGVFYVFLIFIQKIWRFLWSFEGFECSAGCLHSGSLCYTGLFQIWGHYTQNWLRYDHLNCRDFVEISPEVWGLRLCTHTRLVRFMPVIQNTGQGECTRECPSNRVNKKGWRLNPHREM